MTPATPETSSVLLAYHAGVERNADGVSLPPQITRAEVERELTLDAWDALVTGNGDYVPVARMGRSRPPAAISGASEDNR